MVAYAKENTLAAAAGKYFVAEFTLRGWMKIQFEDIRERERGQSLKMTKRRSGGGRKLTYPSEIDEEILASVYMKTANSTFQHESSTMVGNYVRTSHAQALE